MINKQEALRNICHRALRDLFEATKDVDPEGLCELGYLKRRENDE